MLFAFAIIVACEKDAFDMDAGVSNITPIEANIESNESVDIDAIKETLDRIMSNAKNYEKKDRSTNRTATPGGSLRILNGTEGSTYFEFLFSDDITVCNEANYSFLTDNIYLTLRSDNGIDVRLNTVDATPLVSIAGDFSTVFGLTIYEGISFDFVSNALGFPAIDGSVITINSVAYDFGCTTTTPPPGWEMTTPNGVMTFTNSAMGSYRLEAAPFPLSGLLATVISEATGVERTKNYAGTGSLGDASTHAGVRNAIETSFANDQD